MFVVEPQLLVLFSHLIILPLWPLKVKVPEFVPEQTIALELVVPPTVLHEATAEQVAKFIPPVIGLAL